MKKLISILSVVAVFLCSVVAASAANMGNIKLICEREGVTFTGEEWTLVSIDESVLKEQEGKTNSEQARAIEEYVKSNHLTGQVGTVDYAGNVVFRVEEGHYLLYRTKKLDDSYAAMPIIVNVPEVVDGENLYDFEIRGKISPASDKDIDTDVKTGDDNMFYVAAFALAAAAGVAGIIAVRKTKKDKAE